MTATDTAQNRSETTRTPLPYAEVDPTRCYDALRRLSAVMDALLERVELDNSLHFGKQQLEHVHAAAQDAHNVLYPPPPPDRPDGCEVYYARALRKGDRLWSLDTSQFHTIDRVQQGGAGGMESVLIHADGYEWWLVNDALVVVVRSAESAVTS